MGNIHYLPGSGEADGRLLENLVVRTIREHPDPAVAERWLEMARQTVRKYPGPPAPSRAELDMSVLSGLAEGDRERVVAELESFMASYFDDVRQQMMSMHRDLLSLQKQLAEIAADQDSAPQKK